MHYELQCHATVQERDPSYLVVCVCHVMAYNRHMPGLLMVRVGLIIMQIMGELWNVGEYHLCCVGNLASLTSAEVDPCAGVL